MTPETPQTYTQRGWTYWNLKEYQQAIVDFNYALELDPNRVEAYSGRGWAYRRLKEYQCAIADFHRVLEYNPNHPAAQNGLGAIYRELKEYRRAITYYNRMIEIDPDGYWGYFQRGYTYLFVKDINQARLDFTRSWELNSTNHRGRWMAEWCGMCQERNDTTTPERLEAIVAIDPQPTTAQICRGVAQWLCGRWEEALAELEQVLSSDPEQWDPYLDKQFDPYFWKGMICASLRRDEEAIAAIEKSLELELPPVLLTPLRWFEQDRPDFYQQYVVPLMAHYDLG